MINSIKEKIIKDFIKENYRSPSQQEIKTLYNSFISNNKSAESTGILKTSVGLYPIAGNESSATKINELVENLRLDQKESFAVQERLFKRLELIFRVFNKKINNSLSIIKKLERTVNKNILLYLKEDIYVNGIVESFEDYDKVDLERSNVKFFNGKVTVGYSKLVEEEFKANSLSFSLTSRRGSILTKKEIGSFANVYKEDGKFYKLVGYSDSPDDICDLIVEMHFPEQEGREINTLKFTSLTPEKNSKVSYKCFYSKDNVNLNSVFESDLRITNGENYIEINESNVKKITLIISKYNFDFIENQKYAYVFSLDFIGHTQTNYQINKESVLYLGPYEILDENNAAVNFSMATLKGATCCLIPEESTIDMYLSKDNINWIKTDFTRNTKEVVQFEESEEVGLGLDTDLVSIVDLTSESNDIVESNIPEGIFLKANEKLLNLYVPIENKAKFIKNSLKIRRNLFNKNNVKLYDANSGWEKIENDFYFSTFEIHEMEGKYLNFGDNSCFINNRLVSGKVFLAQGTYEFKTSTENWFDLNLDDEKEINTLRQLKNLDRLYPYNHKYVLEGFSYSRNFKGKKIYKGVSRLYGRLLKEISLERFNVESNIDNYCIVETANGLYFKIKSQKNSSESKLEDFEFSYRRRNDNLEGNKLYIKAVLKTFNEKVTPKIEQIQARVI
jgi:hypothetical protein